MKKEEIIELMKSNKFKNEQILEGLRLVLDGLGLDLNDENFRETPDRVLRSYYEIFEGLHQEDEVKKILLTSFPTEYNGMITVGPITCFSMCPHHFITIRYKVYVAYIGRERGIGLSKLPRVVELLSKRPALQEDFTKDIVTKIHDAINPKGVAVYVEGEHMCMQARGVNKPDCKTITSEVTGFFRDNLATKEEFLNFIKMSSK